jgi:hypothetical protein
VEDMPFSKFLVRISNSYYQTIGKYTKTLLTGNKEETQHRPPSKRQFMQKYKRKQQLHSVKNQKSGKKRVSLEIMTIPEEMTSRCISTRRIGRASKRSDYLQAPKELVDDMEFEGPKQVPERPPVQLTEVALDQRDCLTSQH